MPPILKKLPSTRRVATELAQAAGRLPRNVVVRMTLRSGAWGAAVDATVGTVEAWWAVRQGADPEAVRGHVLHKAAAGFVVGSTGSFCAAVALSVSGPGLVAFAAGSLGAAGASRVFRNAVGPSPLEREKSKKERKKKTSEKKRPKSRPSER